MPELCYLPPPERRKELHRADYTMSNSKWGNGDDALDEDEYLAQLLAKDARETSLRYSAHGMYAAAPKR